MSTYTYVYLQLYECLYYLYLNKCKYTITIIVIDYIQIKFVYVVS